MPLYVALSTINASRPRKMTVHDLKDALDNPSIAMEWKPHLRALFEECSPKAVGDLIDREHLNPAKLLKIADSVQPHDNTVVPFLASKVG